MSGRIRSIKPEVLDDELAASLSDAGWRLWISMWTLADDFGNVRLGEKYLAAHVWQDSARDVAAPLRELVAKGFLTPYAVNGQRYGHIKGWEKHQRIDNAGKPRVPRPTDDDGTWDQGLGIRFADFSAGDGDARGDVASRRLTPISDHRSPTPEGERAPGVESTSSTSEPLPANLRTIALGTATFQACELAYGEAVREASGSVFGFTNPARWDLRDVLNSAHVPRTLRGEELVASVRASVVRYVRDRSENPSREAGYAPKKWLDWLNAGNDRTLSPPPPRPSRPAPRADPEAATVRAMTPEQRAALGRAALAAISHPNAHDAPSGIHAAAPANDLDEAEGGRR